MSEHVHARRVHRTSFRRVRPEHSFQKVAAAVREAVGRGELKPGDQLPSQRELQQLFGVSKVTILEALRLLEADGLVEVRMGRSGGAVLLDASRHSLARALSLLLDTNHADHDEVRELRMAIEAQAARLAALRATPEQVAHMEHLLTRLDALARGSQGGEDAAPSLAERVSFLSLDLEFHTALAAASGNRLLQALMDVVYHLLIQQAVPVSPARQAHLNRTLRRVLDQGIKAHAPHVAARAMSTHLADSYRVIRAMTQAETESNGG